MAAHKTQLYCIVSKLTRENLLMRLQRTVGQLKRIALVSRLILRRHVISPRRHGSALGNVEPPSAGTDHSLAG